MISLIAAVDKAGVIGYKNELPWDIPEDLKYFNKKTRGRVVIMGRKTFESIGKPLPDRVNIVLTRNMNYEASGCLTFNTPSQIIYNINMNEEVFVIGGSEIYQQFIDIADKLYLTEIDNYFKGDAHFPYFDRSEWKLVSSNRRENGFFTYSFNVYERILKIK